MIPPVWLKVAGAIFTVTDLKKGLDPTGFNQHEKNVVDFCRRWLGGQQQFQFHTSGSTGAAKLITFRRDQLETSAQLTIDALNLKPGQTALICLDTRFIAGAMMIVRSLVTGLN